MNESLLLSFFFLHHFFLFRTKTLEVRVCTFIVMFILWPPFLSFVIFNEIDLFVGNGVMNLHGKYFDESFPLMSFRILVSLCGDQILEHQSDSYAKYFT